MDDREAADALAGRSAESAASLVALANGWPAVIGLASVSTAEIERRRRSQSRCTNSLPRRCSQHSARSVQAGLATLAVAPILDREVAATRARLRTTPTQSVPRPSGSASSWNGATSSNSTHSPARFWRSGAASSDSKFPPMWQAKCLSIYRKRREWDAALDVIAKHGLTADVELVLTEALDDLLDTARLSSIEQWLATAREAKLDGPIFALARAELALRYCRFGAARAYAEVAASSPVDSVVYRALTLAGRAAHLASDEEGALELYQRAEGAASSEGARRDALWGQLFCLIDLELPSATETLRELTNTMNASDLREVVRAATCTMTHSVRFGRLDPTPGDAARDILEALPDPIVVSSFQSLYAAVLASMARYHEALAVASELLSMAHQYRLDFAVPYALNSAAVAHAGMRQWTEADNCCNEAFARARSVGDLNAEQFTYAVRTRVLAQQGRYQSALSVRVPALRPSLPSARGGSSMLARAGSCSIRPYI